MRAIRYNHRREMTFSDRLGLSQSAMRAIRYNLYKLSIEGMNNGGSQSAMRAIRYNQALDVSVRWNHAVAIRYACNKI